MHRTLSPIVVSSVALISGCGIQSDVSLLCRGTQTITKNMTDVERIDRTFGFYIIAERALVDGVTFENFQAERYVFRGVNTDPYGEFSMQKDTGLLRFKTTFKSGSSITESDFEGHCYRPPKVI